MKDENKEEARETIKDLLQDDGMNLPIVKEGDLPSFHQVDSYDYVDNQTKSIQKAKKMMDSVMKL